MSEVSIRIDGELDGLLKKLNDMAGTNKKELMKAIAEGLRTSTVERFGSQTDPDGKKWTPSIRASKSGGKTLMLSSALRTSIKSKADSKGAAVGTNLVYGATHQFGAERTIRARKAKALRFKIGSRWVSKKEVNIRIPARPFLGISDDDMVDIKELIEEALME